MYNPDGYMSAQLMQQGRPAYASGDLHTGTKDEMAEAAHGYLAYAGKYELDEENQTVYHTMNVSMNPTWLGDTQPRVFKLDGNTLSIENGNNLIKNSFGNVLIINIQNIKSNPSNKGLLFLYIYIKTLSISFESLSTVYI